MVETVVEREAPAMERLQVALAMESAAQAAKARAILDLALEHDWREGDEFEMVGPRPVRVGGDGTPLVDESLPLEIAALTATSVTSATLLIRDIVNLHSRHPSAWSAVQDGRVLFWRARQLAQLVETFELGFGECLLVDAKIEPLLGRLGCPTAQIYVHLGSDTLEDGGPARVEKLGPVLVDELSHVVGHHRIKLTPVVYVNDAAPAVDAYEIPEPMREAVLGRDRHEVFPYSSREARRCDLDHTIPYVTANSVRPVPRTSAR